MHALEVVVFLRGRPLKTPVGEYFEFIIGVPGCLRLQDESHLIVLLLWVEFKVEELGRVGLLEGELDLLSGV